MEVEDRVTRPEGTNGVGVRCEVSGDGWMGAYMEEGGRTATEVRCHRKQAMSKQGGCFRARYARVSRFGVLKVTWRLRWAATITICGVRRDGGGAHLALAWRKRCGCSWWADAVGGRVDGGASSCERFRWLVVASLVSDDAWSMRERCAS